MENTKVATPATISNFSIKIQRFYTSVKYNKHFYRAKKFKKRVQHLAYRFSNEDRLKTLDHKLRQKDRLKNECIHTVELFGTLDRKLSGLFRELDSFKANNNSLICPDLRYFRGKFSKVVREHRSLSKRELCLLLNSHPDIAMLDEKYPCFHCYYPFTEKFLSEFENNTNKVLEYCRQGFLFGVGFPTDELTHLIAKICHANEEYCHFESCWSRARYGF